MKNLIAMLTLQLSVCLVSAQQKEIVPDLAKVGDQSIWTSFNRNASFDNDVYLDAAEGDGIVRLNDLVFKNGRIELDIKGKNVRGRSFVGIAFHGLDNETYDVVYFRPFNFEDPQRNSHSVQYISHSEHTWFKLREAHPGEYENPVEPVPDPQEWFRATIIVDHPSVKVYVNDSEKTSLEINQLNSRKEGWIGFWVGNGSDGNFRNLKVIPEE